MSGTLLNLETAINYLSGSGSSTTVQLGSVTLSGIEVPNSLSVGGQQQIVVHRLPGGQKIIDNGGNDPAQLSLNGIFTGPQALSRAKMIETMRLAGKSVSFQAAGGSWQVYIRLYSYDYAKKGAVIVYQLTLEVMPAVAATSSIGAGTSALSSIVGTGVTDSLKTVTATISSAATAAQDITSQAQNVIGTVTPIANMIGLGSPLAKATNYLTAAQGLASSGTNLANAPAALSGTISGLESTVSSLGTTVNQTAANIGSITDTTGASLIALTANSGLHIGSLEASNTATVALKNARSIEGA